MTNLRLLLLLFLLAPMASQAITCTKYLRSSDGSDGDNGTTWALAYATLAYALSQVSAGDTICVDDDHSESLAAPSLTNVGSATNPVKIIVVTTDTTTPVSTYPGSPNYTMTSGTLKLQGNLYFWGMNLLLYDGLFLQGTHGAEATFEKSKIVDQVSDDGSGFSTWCDICNFIFIDTDIGDASFRLMYDGRIIWKGGTYISTSTEYDYLIHAYTEGGEIDIEGVDLSQWAGSTALVNTALSTNISDLRVKIINSRLPSSYTAFSGSSYNTVVDGEIVINGSGNTDEYYNIEDKQLAGGVSVSTSVYRSGGATYDGTNGFSVRLDTTSSALEGFVCVRRKLTSYGGVDSTSTANAAVHITYDSASAWDNSDFFIDIKYPNATNEAYGNWVSTAPSPLNDTPSTSSFTDVSGTETWNGTSGFSNPREETVDVDFTGAEGLIEIWVNFCKPSSTIYVDMLPDISAANDPQYLHYVA